MNAKEKSIMGALADQEVDFYTIPEFQRPFTWESSHIQQLWDDFYESYNDYTTSIQDDPQSKIDNYFLEVEMTQIEANSNGSTTVF